MSTPLPPKTHYLSIISNLELTLWAMKEMAKEHPVAAPSDEDIKIIEDMLQRQRENMDVCD